MTAGPGSLTLSGGGAVVEYAQQSKSQPHGRLDSGNLTSVDNTISGGQLNSDVGLYIGCTGVLTNESKGDIENQTAKSYVNEAEIKATTIYNSGKINNNGGNLFLEAQTVINSGVLSNDFGQALFVTSDLFDSSGAVKLGLRPGDSEVLAATIANSGTVTNLGAESLTFYADQSLGSFTNTGVVVNSGKGSTTLRGGSQGGIDNKGTIVASAGYVGFAGPYGSTTSVSNSGLIEATGGGSVTFYCPITNSGQLEVLGGAMTFKDAVTSAEAVSIAGGTLEFRVTTATGVQFVQTSGDLVLDQSRGFTGVVSGFSASVGTSLDLRDIGFVGANEATFSGSATAGVLTVSDGTRTAMIHLAGDYLSAHFTAASDGHGGVLVTAGGTTSSQGFVAAMAIFAPEHAAATQYPRPQNLMATNMLAVPLA